MNQHILKMRQIQRNKIYDTLVKFVNGLLKEVYLSVQASVHLLQCFKWFNVSVLVSKDSSAFTKAILMERSKAICIVKLIWGSSSVFGPVNVMSISKKRYALVIVDDYSKYTWVLFLHSKDETPEMVIDHLKLIELDSKFPVRAIRSDNGTKFKNVVLKDFFTDKRITKQYSAHRTPQQNGVVERKNRTLIETTRTMLSESKLPMYF